MDGAAHRAAERAVDELVALDPAEARELRSDHERREVHAVVGGDADRGARKRGLDLLGRSLPATWRHSKGCRRRGV